ncbi:MAG: Crp/Fnr family transcriptional regulator [Rhodopila sp.]|nr:Crp/Fnr family transcriptional regulator [Rhodopila sp.]
MSPPKQLDVWTDLVAAESIRLRSLASGQSLFQQGEPVSALYRLESGRVRLVRHTENGTEVVVHIARPGETFAEASAFADAYHCDAVAETASRVVAMPKAAFLAALARDPETSVRFARVLARQVVDLRARIELRNIRSAHERLLTWLRLRADGNPLRAALDGTWTDVAAEIGLTREALYRALAKLDAEGRIVRTRREVLVRDWPELVRKWQPYQDIAPAGTAAT